MLLPTRSRSARLRLFSAIETSVYWPNATNTRSDQLLRVVVLAQALPGRVADELIPCSSSTACSTPTPLRSSPPRRGALFRRSISASLSPARLADARVLIKLVTRAAQPADAQDRHLALARRQRRLEQHVVANGIQRRYRSGCRIRRREDVEHARLDCRASAARVARRSIRPAAAARAAAGTDACHSPLRCGPLVEPLLDFAMPLHAVRGLEHPVILVREDQQAARDAAALQRR